MSDERQELDPDECLALLEAIDRGEARAVYVPSAEWRRSAFDDDASALWMIETPERWRGWRVSVFKDGPDFSWDYVEYVEDASGRRLDAQPAESVEGHDEDGAPDIEYIERPSTAVFEFTPRTRDTMERYWSFAPPPGYQPDAIERVEDALDSKLGRLLGRLLFS